MQVPIGFLEKLWSFASFLPFFFLFLLLGLFKALIVGPISSAIILIGNSSVIIGLWPAHFIWTYYCLARTKRMGLVLKTLALILFPLPLLLWPVTGIAGSLIGGVAYGFFTPLMATFEAVGESITSKSYHCFVDGSLSTIKGSCTVVMDFTDFCFHSYFSYMDELREMVSADAKPLEIRLSLVPSCLLAGLIGVVIDGVLITVVALYKSPYMLLKGWKRLLEDLVGREGPFLETVCVPFAGLAICLWPLAVVGAVIASVFSSFFLGLYSGVIVHQEDSFRMGCNYIIAAVSLFDEYVNDLLYIREGTCLPRPCYRTKTNTGHGKKVLGERKNVDLNSRINNSRLVSEQSRTLKKAITLYKPVQVWEWLFKSCEVNGRILIRDSLVNVKDVEQCLVRGNCKKLFIQLPAWTVLQCLLASAKSDSTGLVITDGVELTELNSPKDKVFVWLIGPLLTMKEQIKNLKLTEDEEYCLRKLVMVCKNERTEDWDSTGFPSSDSVRKAQLQAIIRRLQGMVASISRIPTFRRRFMNLVKVLYIEALEVGASKNRADGILITERDQTQKLDETATTDLEAV
ncbi:Uncharacterized protein Rs2_11467 [Raphanus sativus]|uniref:Uncharacterized membrane protein At3g27390 isoform X1 n=1 Tax=Raphanus sativus TaxID=3726 RepID=A0A6J0MV17_RAPSA|nr:uncharacterized membrane protein At3g27390 isoform X1 [Raphanus sativus]KAJ4907809.1 Uncharacterized protein Rs2_11467 [Raphanus sativus]